MRNDSSGFTRGLALSLYDFAMTGSQSGADHYDKNHDGPKKGSTCSCRDSDDQRDDVHGIERDDRNLEDERGHEIAPYSEQIMEKTKRRDDGEANRCEEGTGQPSHDELSSPFCRWHWKWHEEIGHQYNSSAEVDAEPPGEANAKRWSRSFLSRELGFWFAHDELGLARSVDEVNAGRWEADESAPRAGAIQLFFDLLGCDGENYEDQEQKVEAAAGLGPERQVKMTRVNQITGNHADDRGEQWKSPGYKDERECEGHSGGGGKQQDVEETVAGGQAEVPHRHLRSGVNAEPPDEANAERGRGSFRGRGLGFRCAHDELGLARGCGEGNAAIAVDLCKTTRFKLRHPERGRAKGFLSPKAHAEPESKDLRLRTPSLFAFSSGCSKRVRTKVLRLRPVRKSRTGLRSG